MMAPCTLLHQPICIRCCTSTSQQPHHLLLQRDDLRLLLRRQQLYLHRREVHDLGQQRCENNSSTLSAWSGAPVTPILLQSSAGP